MLDLVLPYSMTLMLMNQTQESGFIPNTHWKQKSTSFLQIQMSTILVYRQQRRLWQQAQCNHMQLAPLQGHGWTRDRDGNLDIYWDTEKDKAQGKEQGRLTNEGVQL